MPVERDANTRSDAEARAWEENIDLRAVLRTMRQPLLVLDGALKVERANSVFYTCFDVQPEETVGARIYDLGNGQWNIPKLRDLLEDILPSRGEVTDYRVDHDFERIGRRVMILNGYRMERPDRSDRILLSIDDVTERERTRRELVGQKEYAEKIVDASRDALLVLGLDLRVRSANDTFYDAFLTTPEETEGRLVYELGNDQWNIPRLRELLENVLPDNDSFDDFEVEHDFPGIGRRAMILNARRVDHLQLILLAIEDRTAVRRATADLRESETRLRTLAGASADATFRMNPDWTELRELEGRGFLADADGADPNWLDRYIPPEDRTMVQAAIEAAIEQPAPIALEHLVIRADGTPGWASSRAVPVFDAAGGLVEWFGTSRDITARKSAEARERRSDIRYRQLFDSIDQGFCVIEMIFDDAGRPADYRFVEVNAAFERQTGLTDAAGRTMRELRPEHEKFWFETYGRIAKTRKPERFEHAAEGLGAYYEVFAFPVGPPERRRVGVLFNDVIDRKRTEEALTENEARHGFLLKLSDALRPIADAEEIQRVAVHMLGEHLAVDQAFYFRTERAAESYVHVAGQAHFTTGRMPARSGGLSHADFGQHLFAGLERGEPVAVDDVGALAGLTPEQRARYAALHLRSFLIVPIVKEGRYVAGLSVWSPEPRDWLDSELHLVAEVADRVWAAVERARTAKALRASEARHRALFDSIDEGVCLIERLPSREDGLRDYRCTAMNPAMQRMFGIPDLTGRSIRDGFADEAAAWYEDFDRVFETGEPLRVERDLDPRGMVIEMFITRIDDSSGPYLMAVMQDVTARRRAENALREEERRQRFMLDLTDALRPLSDPVRIQEEATRLLGRHLGVARALYGDFVTEGGVEFIVVEHEYRAPGVTSVVGTYPAGQFAADLDELRAGRPVRTRDTETEAERDIWRGLGVRARLGVPLVKDGRLVAGLAVHSDVPRDWTQQEIELVQETGERTWSAVERARAEAALRESEKRFRQFGEASSDSLWIRDAETLEWEYLSPAFERIYGTTREDALSGRGFDTLVQLVVPEDQQRVYDTVRSLRESDKVYEYRIRRPSDGEIRWLRSTGFRLIDADGAVRRLGGITHDMTSEKRAVDRMEVLVGELQHRTRNLIAVVRAFATRTLRSSDTLEEFGEQFGSRLDALARVNGLLSRLEEGDRIAFDELLETELGGHGYPAGESARDKITVGGPGAVWLPSASVQTLALALHELLTNATKYGALGREDGQLSIEWAVIEAETPRLRVDWTERWTEIREETAPGARRNEGFGRKLIEQALPFQLGAQTTYALTDTGLHCTVLLPIPPRTGG